ncbi:ZmpA/ZmpB/ZmpC family metallo-endopeptidase [Streptococcus hillyeri]|uniref:YSIRK-type signal peptide-containing protein n=1 Tax=Streptococcus hillyeri TaxID=2282420 RepID=A0A3L9DUS9_9STRE|nr:ZmpA/ZmpB/ZmpC family metallo-endopeptidase [Streptococcus hillyeri]RLY03998.1 YSIRK-type signal peptide-containing protein [Streptococcus hillyeri]
MPRIQRFSIKKLSVGVCSICIGYAFLSGAVVRADVVTDTAESTAVVVSDLKQASEDSAPLLTKEEQPILGSEPVLEDVEETQQLQPQDSESTALPLTKDLEVTDKVSPENTAVEAPKEVSKSEEDASAPLSQTGFRAATTATTGSQTAIDVLTEEAATFPNSKVIAILSSDDQKRLNEIVVTNFETKANEVALRDVVKPVTSLTIDQITKYLTPTITKLRTEAKNRGEDITNTEVLKGIVAQANKQALAAANADLYKDEAFSNLAPEAKTLLTSFLDKGLLATNQQLTVSQLRADLGALYRGVLYLQQQFSFAADLPERLVFDPQMISGTAERDTAYDRLKAYGTVSLKDPQRVKRSMTLLQNINQFQDRKVAYYTGTANPADLVERLAQEKGKSAADYFEEQTQALVGSVSGTRIFDLLKANRPELILPLLSQGKGLYAATTSKTVSVGMLASYVDQFPELANFNKARGDKQPELPFFAQPLAYQENFVKFLESVKVKPISFTLAIDTMNRYNTSGKIGWSPSEGDNAEKAVINFFVPMNYYDSTYSNAKNLGGMSTSQTSMRIFENRLMAKEAAGLAVFTHELTHSNDEEGLFGGTYQKNGRRKGQGAELYARGLFEVIDNTQNQKASEFVPVFNLNTAIEIAKTPNRVQAALPQTSKEALENYSRNLMDLVAYLEVKEAEAALASLSAEDQAIYFNKVAQVNPQLRSGAVDTARVANKSTNDQFVPFGKLGQAEFKPATSVADLVDQAAVSGQFIPRGVTPFIRNLDTNQYDNVPLLESFYAANVAPSGMNTVGDISFKRNAYEILGWQGWDAFVDYLSNRYTSDQEVFSKILADDTEKSWADYKKAQYNRLSELEAVNHLWETDTLMADLKVAIQKDLAVIKNFKAQVEPSWTTATVTDSEVASRLGFPTQATNVRKVKLAILRAALDYNELVETVLVKDQIETAKGSGLAQDAKPELIWEIAKGSGLVQEEKPELVWEIAKGSGLVQDAKPELVWETAKGPGLVQDAKPELIWEIAKGSGLVQDAKPELIWETAKGSGLVQEEKPELVWEIAKGSGLVQESKPELL